MAKKEPTVNLAKLYELDDNEFRNCLGKILDENLRRLSISEDKNYDPASSIIGNESSKRASLVAATGGHSILFAGEVGCGKTALRVLSSRLGNNATAESWLCPCGYYSGRYRSRGSCHCTAGMLTNYRQSWTQFEMYCEVLPPVGRELNVKYRGLSLQDMLQQLATARQAAEPIDAAQTYGLFNDVGLSAKGRAIAIRIARSIAKLDDCKTVEFCHVAEAINYSTERLYNIISST